MEEERNKRIEVYHDYKTFLLTWRAGTRKKEWQSRPRNGKGAFGERSEMTLLPTSSYDNEGTQRRGKRPV